MKKEYKYITFRSERTNTQAADQRLFDLHVVPSLELESDNPFTIQNNAVSAAGIYCEGFRIIHTFLLVRDVK